MPDARHPLALLLHPLDVLVWLPAGVHSGLEPPRCVVDGAAEARADRQKAGHEGGDEVFAGAGGDDGVVGPGDAGAVGSGFGVCLRGICVPFRCCFVSYR